ncbi:MAG: 2-oxoglutarate dehydrogenase E1 component [Deferrisomatales bacterium]
MGPEFPGAWNAVYVDEQYARWREDPEAVSPQWRAFFEGFELGAARPPAVAEGREASAFQAKADALLQRHRDVGHLLACLDPLASCATTHPLLEPEAVGLGPDELDRPVWAPELFAGGAGPLGEALRVLRETYCRSMGVEYTHLQDPDEREWLRSRLEPARSRAPLPPPAARQVLDTLVRANRFEQFLHKRYLGQTRFSLEGAEVLVPVLRELARLAAARGVERVVLGMAHRGRLNVQAHVLGKSYHDLLCQFEATYDPEAVPGGGDVKYHSGCAGEVEGPDGRTVRVVMPENPSHLEAVDPVVEGIVRALQDRLGPEGPRRVLPVLLHGDAAFPGQGIVAETLNLSRLEGYGTGGTVHLVLNNQIGYTTPPEHARSTRYPTDLAKSLMVPIFHVHGEDPEAALFATGLALAYRATFAKDAVVDVVCYRRHGHNEGDEPYFTQPLLYERIRNRPPVHEGYARELRDRGALEEGALEAAIQGADRALEEAYERARSQACVWRPPAPWNGEDAPGEAPPAGPVETGCEATRLREALEHLTRPPQGFRLHRKLARILTQRAEAALEGKGLDWAGAEALAFATLLQEGVAVRLSGEDSRRGTFSQRHCAWFDTATGAAYVPLDTLPGRKAPFFAYDSPLSEAAVVGFEYGYAAVAPGTLVLWEAQYGDFANGAQVIVDQFVASGEAKWQRPNGLVLLLPHGYEGQGPDHSTARPERYLQLCAEDNLRICQPTTPAQYFHLLRRQAKQPVRKPLVVLTPKSLLRHPEVVSPLEALARGAFRPVLDDPEAPEGPPARGLLCTGKVYYDLAARRRAEGIGDVALVRLEQLYPFPEELLGEVARRYGEGCQWCWVQEEPRNMGAWSFVAPRLEAVLGRPAHYVGRPEAASPATGFSFLHREEQGRLVALALGLEPGAGGTPRHRGKGSSR